MEIAQHYPYCGRDPHFYDHPAYYDATPFAAALRDVPDGWSRTTSQPWVHLTPDGWAGPTQGWKIHVSATAAEAGDVIDIAQRYCTENRLNYKFLASATAYIAVNAKYASRGGSGKLITVYPRDDAELRRTLDGLAALLAGRQGPYILSDLRWGDGPLYLRYGGFKKMFMQAPDGSEQLAIAGPDGILVPDQRQPGFAMPEWAQVPDFIAARIAAAATPGDNLPYQIERALHFSNGGGIYLARDRTGKRVVLREARPFAGLDGSGADAVARMAAEARTLRDLAGLDFVPDLIGRFRVWEHHFMAEEYIEGQSLWQFIATGNPLLHETTEADAAARYTSQVLDVLGQIDHALELIHARGYVYGDLHPHNVIIRPDGRVALVDFEVAYRPGTDPPPHMACPGYVAPHATGPARDSYALDCLRLAMFLPLNLLLDLDASKLDTLTAQAQQLFPVPPRFFDQVRQGLAAPGTSQNGAGRLGGSRLGGSRPGASQSGASQNGASDKGTAGMFAAAADDPAGPGMTELTAALARAIRASATPGRADRLFPGDPAGLYGGGYGLAHGAAGVLAALHAAGQEIDPAHLDWLWRAAANPVQARPGLFEGLHGAAWVLHALGRTDQASQVLDRAASGAGSVRSPGIFGGWAGIGLALRYFARATGDAAVADQLADVTGRLAAAVSAATAQRPVIPPDQAGLLHGAAGPAFFFLQLYRDNRDPALLDLARAALDQDIACCETNDRGAVLVSDGHRLLPYLGVGSAGLALPLAEYLQHRDDERLRRVLDGVLLAARPGFTMHSGLFTGRAGLMAVLAWRAARDSAARDSAARDSAARDSAARDSAARDSAAREAMSVHIRRLAWHAIRYQDGIAFPGDGLLRLSMDLATGTAGVLLALHAGGPHQELLASRPEERENPERKPE
jgi:hypothetical protein